MSAHTPGPWRIHGDAAHDAYIVGADGDNGSTFICEIEPANAHARNKHSKPGAAAVANAALIAAAPDMLAALRALENAANVHTIAMPPDVGYNLRAAQARAREAIAKAEGK